MILIAGLFLPVLSAGLVITPENATLTQYASQQETIITLLNDGFSPLGCDLALDYRSAYLSPYVSFSPKQVVLQPQEQANIKVSSQFPASFPPQQHLIRIQPCQDIDQDIIIGFRPPGTAQPGVVIEGLRGEVSDDESALTMTVNIKNTGNVYVFATPELSLLKEGTRIKNISYPRPVIIAPGELYPLTLRHDNTGLAPGSYAMSLQVAYTAGEHILRTDSYTTPFRITALPEQAGTTSWHKLGAIIATIAILLLAGWRLAPMHRLKKEKRLRSPKTKVSLREVRKELRTAQEEFTLLAQEIRLFTEETDAWLRQEQGK